MECSNNWNDDDDDDTRVTIEITSRRWNNNGNDK